jgi:N-acylneuraminate cytidylyltransferase
MIIFIPIKKHSERVPKKNFRLLNNTPLYLHQINKFRKDFKVYVDTDSDEIYTTLSDLDNVVVYKRESNLIGDDTSVNLLIKNLITKYNIDDYICQIHVTSPFLKPETIKNINLNNDYDSYASADIIQSRIWKEENIGFIPINHNPMKLEKTQDLSKYYVENSGFYIFNSKTFLKYENRIGINPQFIELSFPENEDIDNEKDWDLVLKLNKIL